MMTPLDEASTPGVPLGRYRLIALLGQGGMADVYLACTQGVGGFRKLLVVKLARFTDDPVSATMFLSEARLAAQLSHPNIIETFEIGEESTHRYIVMEYLDGGNLSHLRHRLAKRGGIPLRISLHILLQVLEGLEYAHEAIGLDGRALWVVHRDLSPSNIMCTAQGAVKILDFGIAKAADSARLTQTGKFSGKLQYMPPEQVRGEQVDARADLFAVGVMLAEAILGQRLWGSKSTSAIAIELSAGRIPSLDRGTPLHPSLRQICQRALAPDRAYRYASARELKQDLAAFVATLGPPVSPRDLAELVRMAIESDRAKRQAVIDGQLQRIGPSRNGGASNLLDLPRVEHTPTHPEGAPAVPGWVMQIDSGPVSTPPVTQPPPPPAPTEAPRWWTAHRIALAGPALVVVVASGIWAARGGTRGDGPSPQTAHETPAPAPTRVTVRFEVVVQPADATLSFDGKPLGANPFVGELARDVAMHQLAASAPGYQPSVQMVTLERDATFHLNLAKLSVTEAPAVAPPAPVAPPTSVVAAPTAVESSSGARRPVIAPPAVPRPRPAAVRPPAPRTPSSPAVEAMTKPPEAKRALDTSALDRPATNKRALDTDVLDGSAGSKRALDSDVLDSGSNKPKPALDRETPWRN